MKSTSSLIKCEHFSYFLFWSLCSSYHMNRIESFVLLGDFQLQLIFNWVVVAMKCDHCTDCSPIFFIDHLSSLVLALILHFWAPLKRTLLYMMCVVPGECQLLIVCSMFNFVVGVIISVCD